MCQELQKKVDYSYVLDMETADNKKGLVFTGFTKTLMLLHKKTNRWSIISLDDESVIMELSAEVCTVIIFN